MPADMNADIIYVSFDRVTEMAVFATQVHVSNMPVKRFRTVVASSEQLEVYVPQSQHHCLSGPQFPSPVVSLSCSLPARGLTVP